MTTDPIPLKINIDRALYNKLVQLKLIDPSKRKSGITGVVRRGLQYVIDDECNYANHMRRLNYRPRSK
jgi:hypothetical protein